MWIFIIDFFCRFSKTHIIFNLLHSEITRTMDFIKGWFRYDNKTGCRFIIVDAYNEEPVIKFYQRNDFSFLQPEEDELTQLHEERGEEAELKTRHMLFDLGRLE